MTRESNVVWCAVVVGACFCQSAYGQRINDSLVVLYDFTEGQGNVVNDLAPSLGVAGDPINLAFYEAELSSQPNAGQFGDRPGLISWGPTWLNINVDHPADDGTAHGTPDAAAIWGGPAGSDPADGVGYASKIVEMVQETGQLTLEAWFRPETIENRSNSGRFLWMTVEGTNDASNFVIAQNSCCDGPAAPGGIEIRLSTELDAHPAFGQILNSGPDQFQDRDLVHVVHTHDTSTEETKLYINIDGEAFDIEPAIDETVFGADFSAWDPDYVLTVGNDAFRFSRWFGGELHLIAVHNRALSVDEVQQHFAAGPIVDADVMPSLQAGDADRDLDFDQLDLVQVQIAAKYLSGTPATWGEGDWDGAPGGSAENPPAGNGQFDQLDIISALAAGKYLTGPYAAIKENGTIGDEQTTLVYNAGTGELSVDSPAGVQLTSINIDSAAGIFTGGAAQNLGGSFDNDADNNIFKATFGGSFGSVSFGDVAQAGLSQEFVLNDLSVVGSLAGGGDLGEVDLVYVPEPASMIMLVLGTLIGLLRFRRTGT